MPHAVLFDLDGTLLDTLADIAAGTNSALRSLGLPEHPVEAYRRMVGSGIQVLAERALGQRATPELVAQVVRAAGARMAENRFTRPYEGVPEALDALTKRFVLGILSNKPHEIVNGTVQRFFPDIRFSAVHGQKEGIPEKPDPTVAIQIMEALQSKGVTVYVGDSDIDMQTARTAGMHAVGAAWGFRGRAELESAGADAVIDRPDELVGVVDSLLRGETDG